MLCLQSKGSPVTRAWSPAAGQAMEGHVFAARGIVISCCLRPSLPFAQQKSWTALEG